MQPGNCSRPDRLGRPGASDHKLAVVLHHDQFSGVGRNDERVTEAIKHICNLYPQFGQRQATQRLKRRYRSRPKAREFLATKFIGCGTVRKR